VRPRRAERRERHDRDPGPDQPQAPGRQAQPEGVEADPGDDAEQGRRDRQVPATAREPRLRHDRDDRRPARRHRAQRQDGALPASHGDGESDRGQDEHGRDDRLEEVAEHRERRIRGLPACALKGRVGHLSGPQGVARADQIQGEPDARREHRERERRDRAARLVPSHPRDCDAGEEAEGPGLRPRETGDGQRDQGRERTAAQPCVHRREDRGGEQRLGVAAQCRDERVRAQHHGDARDHACRGAAGEPVGDAEGEQRRGQGGRTDHDEPRRGRGIAQGRERHDEERGQRLPGRPARGVQRAVCQLAAPDEPRPGVIAERRREREARDGECEARRDRAARRRTSEGGRERRRLGAHPASLGAPRSALVLAGPDHHREHHHADERDDDRGEVFEVFHAGRIARVHEGALNAASTAHQRRAG
jgi:hypothetical protein